MTRRVNQTAIAATVMGACLLVGCSVLTPGFDTQQALRTDDYMRWTAANDIEISNRGTQNQTIIMADGEVVLNDDGSIDGAKSTLSSYFYRKSEPKDAATAYAALAEKNLEFGKSLTDLIREVLPYVPQVIAAQRPVTTTAPATDRDGDAGFRQRLAQEFLQWLNTQQPANNETRGD